MEVAIEAPLTIVHEPLFAEPEPEVEYQQWTDAGPEVHGTDHQIYKIEDSYPAIESEWESDDDVPLATLHGVDTPEPTLAELLARTKRDADTQLKKATIALERPCPPATESLRCVCVRSVTACGRCARAHGACARLVHHWSRAVVVADIARA